MGEQAEYRTILNKAEGEITEKKSRFIATLSPVSTEKEANFFIESVRKRYYDARHNCFAYLVTGEKSALERFSDDGEPGGTAGRPMLEVLRGEGLVNVAGVVTRYFGGVLLGTGGLVRAYTQAVKEALKSCEFVFMRYGLRYGITVEYSLTGKMQFILASQEIKIEDTVYTDKCRFHVIVPVGKEQVMIKEITESTGGKAILEKGEGAYYMEKEA